MAIVSYGTDGNDEVESYLGLKEAITTTTPMGVKLDLLIKSVEFWLKEVTGRNFEQQTYTNEIIDMEEHQRSIQLSDFPITTFTSLSYVSDRDTNGVVTLTTVQQDSYVVHLTRGYLESLSGPFSPWGPQSWRATYTAGYTATEITTNAANEIPIWKALELSIIAKEWGLIKENKRHLSNINFGDESETFMFTLDAWQRTLLQMLTRRYVG